MTSYTFVGDPNHTSVSWTTPAVWSTDTVPNDPTADVVIPAITLEGGGQPYVSTISVSSTIDIAQLYLVDNTVDVTGALTVGGEFEIGSHGVLEGQSVTVGGALVLTTAGFVTLSGTLHTGSVQNDGLIQHGTIVDAGAFLNQAGGVVEGTGQTITAASFDNLGQLNADSGNLTIDAAAFTNLSGSTLTGGQYEAGSGFIETPHPFDLDFNVGGTVTTDAAEITLTNGSEMAFYDSTQSAYQPIEATLQNIASSGVLILVNMSDTWGALTIDGQLVNEGSTLGASQLTIDANGGLQGYGTVTAPIVDNGVLTVGTSTYLNQAFPLGLEGGPPPLDLTGTVTGSGKIEFAPTPQNVDNGLPEPWTLELSAAASVEVAFADAHGLLILADVAQFTGSIAPANYLQQTGTNAGDDQVELPGIALSSVTSYSYTGTSTGGTLTIDLSGGSSVSLNFVGDFDTQSFTLSKAGPLSSSPNLMITISSEPTTPHDDLLGQGLSDVLLENSAGQVDVGQLSSGAFALTQIDTLSSVWKFVGNADFLGNGVDQIAIENAAGNLGIGQVSGGSIHFTTIATGLDTKFVETGDFLNLGNDQFLVESVSGQVEIGSVSGGAVTFTQIDTLGSQWSFVGAGDYLGIGHDQFLIENTAGSVGLGQMVGGTLRLETIATGLSGWKIVESGDFLGHGKSDFLLENTSTGQVEVGEVSGSSTTFTVIDTLGPQWSFVGAGDYLGDGKDQILIENTAGNVGIGEVSGSSIHFTTVATGFSDWMFH